MNTKPKVLIYDIETMANLGYIWGKYEQNVIKYEKEWYMLCFAYKWLDEKQTHVIALPDFKTWKKDKTDDKELITTLWKLFNEADIIIAHNGNSFDQKKSHARMLVHGLTPPAPYVQIDTKLVAKRYFNFNSNKLDDLANILGLGRKLDTGGFELWLGCASGDAKAWKKMKTYNRMDVILLEKVYLKLRGWIKPVRTAIKDAKCSNTDCGSTHLQRRGVEKRTNGVEVTRVQCQGCGKWGYLPIDKVKK